MVGGHPLHPGRQRPGAQQPRDVVEHRHGRIGGGRHRHREHVGQAGLGAQPGGVGCPVPVEHAHDQCRHACRVAVAERLVVPGPTRPEHLQRRPGGRAHGRQRAGQLAPRRQVHHDHRLAQPDRGVHQLEPRRRHGRPRGAGDQHPPFRLPPGHRGGPPGSGVNPQTRPGPGEDTARLNECCREPPSAQTDQPGAGVGKAPLVGVQPVQPPGHGRHPRGQDEGDRELPREPAHRTGGRRAQVSEPRRGGSHAGEQRRHRARGGEETGQGGGRADREHPDHPAGRRYGQPRRAPPGDLPDDMEGDRQPERDRGEQ